MPSRDSIDKVAKATAREIRALLKDKGITVPEVDGASNEAGLHSLQQLQAVRDALKEDVERKRDASTNTPYTITSDWGEKPESSTPADTMDTGKKGK